MIDNLSRRQFVKFTAAMAASLALPRPWTYGGEVVVLVEVVVDGDKLTEAIHLGPIGRVGGQAGLHCTLDMDRAWQAVTMLDSEGRIWRTDDGGRTFRHGEMAIELFGWDDDA